MDKVKIDYYFINQLHLDPVKREFVKSILSLGQKINARVIAEGIETEQEFEQLQDLGICFGQGFLFGRPVPGDELNVLLLYGPNLAST